jgi:hypothetical protein
MLKSGEDMTSAFYGGIYAHSNAAHNVSITFCQGLGRLYLLSLFTAPLDDASRCSARWRATSFGPQNTECTVNSYSQKLITSYSGSLHISILSEHLISHSLNYI